ncbi:MAG TPA: transposase, partial [Chromatiales bacterium]|nr:transposase [Chromatiales bacterium]
MPRQKRQVVAGMPLHVVQRGVARNDCFFCALDYQNFMVHLADLCEQEMVALH